MWFFKDIVHHSLVKREMVSVHGLLALIYGCGEHICVPSCYRRRFKEDNSHGCFDSYSPHGCNWGNQVRRTETFGLSMLVVFWWAFNHAKICRSSNIILVIAIGALGLLVGWLMEFSANIRSFSFTIGFHVNVLYRWVYSSSLFFFFSSLFLVSKSWILFWSWSLTHDRRNQFPN